MVITIFDLFNQELSKVKNVKQFTDLRQCPSVTKLFHYPTSRNLRTFVWLSYYPIVVLALLDMWWWNVVDWLLWRRKNWLIATVADKRCRSALATTGGDGECFSNSVWYNTRVWRTDGRTPVDVYPTQQKSNPKYGVIRGERSSRTLSLSETGYSGKLGCSKLNGIHTGYKIDPLLNWVAINLYNLLLPIFGSAKSTYVSVHTGFNFIHFSLSA